MTQEPDSMPSPPISVKWTAAAISIVLTIALSYYIIVVLGEIKQVLAYQAFERNLSFSQYRDSALDLDNLTTNLGLFHWLKTPRKQELALSAQEKHLVLKEFHTVIADLDDDSFKDALAKFNALVEDRLRNIIASMPANRANTELLKKIKQLFDEYDENMLRLARFDKQVPIKVEANHDRLIQQSALAGEIAMEFGDFFSLPPALPEDSSELIEFYQGGVLESLPVLQNLPDDIPDLVTLKKLLDGVNGKVSVKGENAPELFNDKLAKLKESSLLFSSRIEALHKNNVALETELKDLKKEVFSSGKDLEEELKRFLLEACRPSISPITRLFVDTSTPLLVSS